MELWGEGEECVLAGAGTGTEGNGLTQVGPDHGQLSGVRGAGDDVTRRLAAELAILVGLAAVNIYGIERNSRFSDKREPILKVDSLIELLNEREVY